MNNMTAKQKSISKNIITSLFIPVVVCLLGIILSVVVGFNQGLDFKGGVIVSVVSETADLNDGKEYAVFKSKVDSVLLDNNVSGSVYIIEKDAITYNDVLVVKIDYKGTEERLQEKKKDRRSRSRRSVRCF